MHYKSTRNPNELVSFREAVINGLAKDGGLYVPEQILRLPDSFFEHIEQLDDQEIAYQVLKPFTEDSLTEDELRWIIQETLAFPLPVIPVEDQFFVLELFHGPTQAFKDVGARFMSRCLATFRDKKEVVVLAATSGDTGSAVANGFYDVPGVSVKVLFPKGKVSPYQEFQMTSLGKNIQAVEVDGTFDDCQALVKKAFQDGELNQRFSLSSANSINIARLLPQMLYYFLAYKQLKNHLNGQQLVISVPSGNLGNLSAGIIAWKMGLPVHRFIAANNANDPFFVYLETGNYEPKASVQTYSNAMDVGNPSNFERLDYFFKHDNAEMKKVISGAHFTDREVLKIIKTCFIKNGYVVDPHGAIGLLALEQQLKEGEIGLFLETAHPLKFAEVVQLVLPDFKAKEVDLSDCRKEEIPNDYTSFLRLFG